MAIVKARLAADGTIRVAGRAVRPRADWARVDATGEREIARQRAADEAEAVDDAAAWARGVRKSLRMTQDVFAARIGVPVATVRNWEQGKRRPNGAARVLLTIISREPEAVRRALASNSA